MLSSSAKEEEFNPFFDLDDGDFFGEECLIDKKCTCFSVYDSKEILLTNRTKNIVSCYYLKLKTLKKLAVKFPEDIEYLKNEALVKYNFINYVRTSINFLIMQVKKSFNKNIDYARTRSSRLLELINLPTATSKEFNKLDSNIKTGELNPLPIVIQKNPSREPSPDGKRAKNAYLTDRSGKDTSETPDDPNSSAMRLLTPVKDIKKKKTDIPERQLSNFDIYSNKIDTYYETHPLSEPESCTGSIDSGNSTPEVSDSDNQSDILSDGNHSEIFPLEDPEDLFEDAYNIDVMVKKLEVT